MHIKRFDTLNKGLNRKVQERGLLGGFSVYSAIKNIV